MRWPSSLARHLPDDLLNRIRRRLAANQKRLQYRLGLPVFGPGKARVSTTFSHPIDVSQRSLLASEYQTLFPESVAKELAEARRLNVHQFFLLGHAMEFGDRIDWSRDPVSGKEWSRQFSGDIAYRGPERLGDIKLPWELNKHQYFFTLGKAACLTGDPTLASEIMRQIERWIEDNPVDRGIHWISALESGTRAVSWIMAYPFYQAYADRSFHGRFARSLAQHFRFVEEHLSTGRFANTHLIGEAAALVAGGLFVDCRHSRRWLEKGLALLEDQIARQATSDGIHVERSVAYHRFFLDHYYLVNALLTANGLSFSAATLRDMERMTEFLMDMLLPDGSAPPFGDADDARGLWLHADAPADFRSLLALGAIVFGRGDFKAASGPLAEAVFWLYGSPGVDRFVKLATHQPAHTSAAYLDGGYCIMRGGWGPSDPVLVFDCGPLGHGPAGHGHADALSMQLHAGGYPFLVDSGTFSYNLDYSWRDVFRSTRAHNTVVVDGQDQSVPGDRMSWASSADARCRRWVSTRWFDLADGEHDGYRRLPRPVTHRRVVLFIRPDTWWVWDDLTGTGAHQIEVWMHVRPDCSIVSPEGLNGPVLLRSPMGAELHLWAPDGNGETGVPDIVAGGGEDGSGVWFSPQYGVRIPGKALRVRRDWVGRTSLPTCLSTSALAVPAFSENGSVLQLGVMRGEQQTDSVFYRLDRESFGNKDGVTFDGEILFRRDIAGMTRNLWAGTFRELAVAGLLEVRAPVEIETLAFENGCCELVLPPERVSELKFSAAEGTQLVINGRPAAIENKLIYLV